MANGPQFVAAKFRKVLKAWETLCPDKSFAGMTLAQFKLALQRSSDARHAIDVLANQLIAAQDQREAADLASLRLMQLVVNAVKGDPAEGEDSALYEAMGYVRKSARKSGKTHKHLAVAA